MDLEQQFKESNAEKVALDQLYVESLKSILQLRKNFILKESESQQLKAELEQLKKDFEDLKNKSCEKEIEAIFSET